MYTLPPFYRRQNWVSLRFNICPSWEVSELWSECKGFLRLLPSAACFSISVSCAVRQAGNHGRPFGIYFKISKLLLAYKHQICSWCNAQHRLAAHHRADCTRPGRDPATQSRACYKYSRRCRRRLRVPHSRILTSNTFFSQALCLFSNAHINPQICRYPFLGSIFPPFVLF